MKTPTKDYSGTICKEALIGTRFENRTPKKEKDEKNEILEKVSIHRGYAEWEEAKNRGINVRCMFGKYHRIFYSDKGEISLVQIKNYFVGSYKFWEIYCLKGNFFKDTERFDTKKEAVNKIRSYLE